jgi:hypothetical protein
MNKKENEIYSGICYQVLYNRYQRSYTRCFPQSIVGEKQRPRVHARSFGQNCKSPPETRFGVFTSSKTTFVENSIMFLRSVLRRERS